MEDANIKLILVVTDIIGMTGRAMLAAPIAAKLIPASWLRPPLSYQGAAVLDCPRRLRGRIMKHHRFLLRLHLQQIDAIDTAVAEIDREVNERIEPFSHHRRAADHYSGNWRTCCTDHPGLTW